MSRKSREAGETGVDSMTLASTPTALATEEEMTEKINKALEEKGEDWVVAAMVEGSLGYHTPQHARNLIRSFREGNKEDWCERCLAMFQGNLLRMMYYDIRIFERLEEKDPERAKRIIEFVKKVEGLKPDEQIAVGLRYPTMNI